MTIGVKSAVACRCFSVFPTGFPVGVCAFGESPDFSVVSRRVCLVFDGNLWFLLNRSRILKWAPEDATARELEMRRNLLLGTGEKNGYSNTHVQKKFIKKS